MSAATATPPFLLEPTAPAQGITCAGQVRRIGHDLNNALSGIGLYVEMLGADLTGAQACADLAAIASLLEQARGLVRQLGGGDQKMTATA